MSIIDQLIRLRPQLIAYAQAVCGNADQADDLVQDAFERAITARGAPEEMRDLRPWMFRIIRNLHIDDLRKARVRTEYASHHIRLFDENMHDGSDRLRDLLVRQTFEALPPQQREIIFLVDIMGMRYAEAGDVLGVPEGTVMSRLSRARHAMIERLNESNVSQLPRRQRK